MTTAIVRPPSAAFRDALSEHPDRARIDPERAARQHAAFVEAVRATGTAVLALPPDPLLPDATFVSDCCLALPGPDGRARLVVTRPGAPSRRPEVAAVADAARRLAPSATTASIEGPATLEAGDVIVFGPWIAVGLSARTNRAGAEQLAEAARPLGYRTVCCPVGDRLHLASEVTVLSRDALVGTTAGFASLAAAEQAPRGWLDGLERVLVPDDERPAANVLALGSHAVLAAGHPLTAARLRARGLVVHEVGLDEFTRADGGPTCLVCLVP